MASFFSVDLSLAQIIYYTASVIPLTELHVHHRKPRKSQTMEN